MNNVMIILMNRLTRTLLAASFCLLVCTLHAAPLRIVCIGDSITQGRGDHSNGGTQWTPTFSYRYPLWKLLVDAGADVGFVGSLKSGFEGDPDWADYQGRKFDRNHEGHWGWKTGTHTVDWVHPNAAGDQKLARNWLTALRPFLAESSQAQPSFPTKTEASSEVGQTRRVYFVGNSVTDTVNYNAFAKSVHGLNDKLTWGRQMIPGCPLFGLWRAAEQKPDNCGFTEKPFGGSIQALRDFQWDAVTLQPFDRLLANPDPKNNDDQGDVLYAQKYLDLAWQRSPDAQVYIYARWPRMLIKGKGVDFDKDAYTQPDSKKTSDWSQVDPFAKRWLAKYTGGWDTSNETADYFETLTRILRNVNPYAKRPVLMIPVGHVMFELDKQMQAGELPGYKGVYDVYKDAIHLTKTGSYIVGCTFYATVYQKDPKGFPGQPYGVTDEKVLSAVQQTVWKVVRTHPLTGIAPQEPIEQKR